MGINCSTTKRKEGRKRTQNNITINGVIKDSSFQRDFNNYSNINSFNSYHEKPKSLFSNDNDNVNENNNNKLYKINDINKNNQMISIKNKMYKDALEIHNKYRLEHGSTKLTLKLDLCEIAQKYAEQCSETNTTDHYCYLYNNNEIIGQNIEIVDKLNVSDICKKWYNEKDKYDFSLNKFNSKARHFTQLIWRDTKYVGFGYSKSDDGKIYFVAYYYPAGNIFNKFSENVLI